MGLEAVLTTLEGVSLPLSAREVKNLLASNSATAHPSRRCLTTNYHIKKPVQFIRQVSKKF